VTASGGKKEKRNKHKANLFLLRSKGGSIPDHEENHLQERGFRVRKKKKKKGRLGD